MKQSIAGRTRRVPRFAGRALAEAVGAYEQALAGTIDDVAANDLARQIDGDLEAKIIARAQALSIAAALKDALDRQRHSIGLLVAAFLALATAAGAAAARAALGTGAEPVNFYLVLAGLLGLQTVLLLAWLVLALFAARGAPALWSATLGGLIVRLAQRINTALHRDSAHAAAASAIASIYTSGPLAKWTVSAISHALWLAFNVGALVVVIALLSAREYTFIWETTILSKESYVALTDAIAASPRALGFDGPTPAQVEVSQRVGESLSNPSAAAGAGPAWAGLFVGSLITYGFAARLLLLAFCLGQRRMARRRYRLDLTRPQFIRLRAKLEPEAQKLGVIDADDASATGPAESLEAHAQRARPAARPAGAPAIVGFELAGPASRGFTELEAWPPRVHGVRWADLGFVDSREDRRRVVRELRNDATEPEALIVVCALTTTPDRGAAAFLAELRGSVSRPVTLLLTGGHAMRQRGSEHLKHRIEDWRRTAAAAGIAANYVIEIDLDHPTDASLARLRGIAAPGETDSVGATARHRSGSRRIETAFDRIIAAVAPWFAAHEAPSLAVQSELHREIAGLYRDQGTSWQGMLRAPTSLGSDLVAQVRAGSARMLDLLPQRLRLSPKWLSAGALAGALGCVAAASLLTPLAISALPLWSGIGAAVAALVQPRERAATGSSNEPQALTEIGAAIRSAALFALLLELQGRGEGAITRLLDQALPQDSDETPLRTIDDARQQLDQIRHRLDLALAEAAREAGS